MIRKSRRRLPATGLALAALVLAPCACENGTDGREATVPTRPTTDVITIMLDHGWWVQVRRDGGHALGYGALPARIPVAPDALDVGRLHDLVAKRARAGVMALDAEARCRYTATFGGRGGAGSLEHTLPAELCGRLADVFRSAWAARDSTQPTPRPHAVERAWRNAPFLPSDPPSR